MKLVLDTSAILSGLSFEGAIYVTSSVLREARNLGMDPRMESLVESKARILEPRERDLKRVVDAARKTGDEANLSRTDLEVLALALQLGAAVVSDDYSIQNVATKLGLRYRPATLPGIRERRDWTFRCRGCGRFFDGKTDVCPVCGSRVRRYRR